MRVKWGLLWEEKKKLRVRTWTHRGCRFEVPPGAWRQLKACYFMYDQPELVSSVLDSWHFGTVRMRILGSESGLYQFFCLLLFEGTFISFYTNKKVMKEVTKVEKSRDFLLFLLDDGRIRIQIRIQIRIRTYWLTDPDPGGPKNIRRNTAINPNFSSSGSVRVSNDRSWGAG